MDTYEEIKEIIPYETVDYTEDGYTSIMAEDPEFGALLLQEDEQKLVIHSCSFDKETRLNIFKKLIELSEKPVYINIVKGYEDHLVGLDKVVAKLTAKQEKEL